MLSSGNPWTKEEDDYLIKLKQEGYSFGEMVPMFVRKFEDHRSKSAIGNRFKALEIKGAVSASSPASSKTPLQDAPAQSNERDSRIFGLKRPRHTTTRSGTDENKRARTSSYPNVSAHDPIQDDDNISSARRVRPASSAAVGSEPAPTQSPTPRQDPAPLHGPAPAQDSDPEEDIEKMEQQAAQRRAEGRERLKRRREQLRLIYEREDEQREAKIARIDEMIKARSEKLEKSGTE